MSEELALVVAEHNKKGNIVIPPPIGEARVSPFFVVRVWAIKLAEDEWHYMGYSNRGATYMPTGTAIKRIAANFGIVWDASKTRRLDDMKSRDYVYYQAVGAIRYPDGTWKNVHGSYELDLQAVEAQIKRDQWRKVQSPDFKLPKALGYMEGQSKEAIWKELVESEMIQKRRHKLALAETGAKLRAIRGLGLKSSFTKEETQKEIVGWRVDRSPDYNDPNVKAVAKEYLRKEISDLYGAPIGLDYAAEHEIPEGEHAEFEELPEEQGGIPEEDQEPDEKASPGWMDEFLRSVNELRPRVTPKVYGAVVRKVLEAHKLEAIKQIRTKGIAGEIYKGLSRFDALRGQISFEGDPEAYYSILQSVQEDDPDALYEILEDALQDMVESRKQKGSGPPPEEEEVEQELEPTPTLF